jgi:PPM family protein phosphatase
VALVLHYAARSDVGKIRSKNDDSAYVGRYLAVVADGMGGHAGGDVASASTVLDLVHLDHKDYDDDAGTVLADEIQTANSLLSELVQTDPRLAGMGTTVTAILLSGDRLEFAHIGDSRAYRLKNGVFEQISTDHTFVQRLIDEGRLRPEEAEIHPHKNVLMRVLGDVDASPELDLHSFAAEAGERWLLCSDGLNAVIRDSEVEQIVRHTPDRRELVNTLVEMVLDGGAPDNVTIAVVDVAEATADETATDSIAALGTAGGDGDTARGDGAVHPAAVPAAVSAAVSPRYDGAVGDGDDTLPSAAPAGRGADPAPVPGDGATTGETGASETGASETAAAKAAAEQPATGTIRAEVIRRDLATRPHILVGAAALATETGQIPIVTQRSTERRAAMLLTHKAPEQEVAEEPELPERRIKRWLIPSFLALMTLILVAVMWFGYAWTQTRYYVAESDNRVAIFNGVSQSLGPIELSHVDTVYEDIPVSNLPEYARQRLANTIAADDLENAKQIVEELRRDMRAVPCPPATAPPPGTPTAGPTAAPSPSPTTPPAEGASTPAAATPPPVCGEATP